LDKLKIFETDQFLKDLEQDFSGCREKIKRKLTAFIYPQIRQNPFFGKNIKKLKNYTPETWRYRLGGYRFFYTVDNKERIIFMLAIDSRQDAY